MDILPSQQLQMQLLYHQRPGVTYAVSSVMWFSGIFQQLLHKALMISELWLHTDALSPTCAGRKREEMIIFIFMQLGKIIQDIKSSFAGESWVLLFPILVIRSQERLHERPSVCCDSESFSADSFWAAETMPPFELDMRLIVLPYWHCNMLNITHITTLVVVWHVFGFIIIFSPFILHFRNTVWQFLHHCTA